MPLPTETELRVQLSPVPTQTILGLDGSIAMSPIDITGWRSNTGRKVIPPSSDFHTPPDAAPTNKVVLPSGSRWPAMAEIRPDIWAEPMLRMPSPETALESATGATGAAAASGEAMTRAAV